MRLAASGLALSIGVVGSAWADDDDDDRDKDRDEHSFKVEDAKWRVDRHRLTVKGEKSEHNTVTVVNAFDPNQVIGQDKDDDDRDWRVRNRRLGQVPCRVRAVDSDGNVEERDVRNAPADCGPKDDNQPPPPNVAPTADANGPYNGETGVNLSFSSTGSNDPDGNIVAFKWTFGDGASSTNANPNHAYATAGTYTVRLMVTDNDGASDTDTTTATIVNNQPPPNVAPTANANGPYSGTAGDDVSFSSAGSNDSDGNISAFNWTFGDGASSTNANPSHAYAAAGTYTVRLTVTDNDGASDTDTTTATIVNNQPPPNVAPTANANGPYSGTAGDDVSFSSAGSNDSDGNIVAFNWTFGDGASSTNANPNHAYAAAGTYTVRLTVTDNDGASDTDTTTATIVDNQPPPVDPPNVSINSTSQNASAVSAVAVLEQPLSGSSSFQIFANNDLGMHCGDLDTRISSILPPFNILHAQVVGRGGQPDILTPNDGISVFYSAASNDKDPILGAPLLGVAADGSLYKTNFWDTLNVGAYNPFYPSDIAPFIPEDRGLPMPDVEQLWLGNGVLATVQQDMPGIDAPYVENLPQEFAQFVTDQPFFVDPALEFGYVAEDVRWFEAAGIALSTFDDAGRENPYPLMRVQAKRNNSVLASVDTVLPISGEANCQRCHAAPGDGGNGSAIGELSEVAISIDDPAHGTVPELVSVEWASDINILRLHDQEHGTSLLTAIDQDTGLASKPVVCQRCHYTPALDLAQVGPNDVNGREQSNHKSMSNVMHGFHATVTGTDGNPLFPDMPSPVGRNPNLAQDLLDETCYSCHPGQRTKCLRGAMGGANIVCQDCHGQMEDVGDDFSRSMPGGQFELASDFYTNPNTPRVPWANEPGCGSCHTGDVRDNMHGASNTLGAPDGIRLLQAYRDGDPKATPIVPSNKRFAEEVVGQGPAAGTGNPQLYRVSNGHEGIYCEACHGSTHAIWPNANANANDNLTAMQLQGHTGTIAECDTCHTNVNNLSTDGSLDSMRGPHGMHAVGDNTDFADGDHRRNLNRNACRACHGNDGEGSVLSRTADDRDFRGLEDGGRVSKGHQVTCRDCHGNEL